MRTWRAARAEQRGIGAIAIAVGLAFVFAPGPLFRLFGLDPARMDGRGSLGWRMFAARNLIDGRAVIAGSGTPRDMVLAVQTLDQAAFWAGYARGELPLRATLMASGTSGVVVALCLRARRPRDRAGTVS